MRTLHIVIISSLLFLSGCGGGFMLQSQKESTVTESIGKSMYTVSFCGNAYMSQKDAEKYAMQRACELTLTKGYTHFAILEKSDQSEICQLQDAPRPDSTEAPTSASFASPESLVRPNLTLKIQAYYAKDAPAGAIDAQNYINENFPGLKFRK